MSDRSGSERAHTLTQCAVCFVSFPLEDMTIEPLASGAVKYVCPFCFEQLKEDER
jgi:hypothetical protein